MYQFFAVCKKENSSFANFGFVLDCAVWKCAVLCVGSLAYSLSNS